MNLKWRVERISLLPWLIVLAFLPLMAAQATEGALPLRTNDVLAVLGGASMVAAQQTGYTETLLAAARPEWRLRWRSLAWEGDTVFAQPREVNFPSLTNQLHQAGATMVLLQFGAMESLAGDQGLPAFVTGYERLLDEVGTVAPRRVLITPAPPASGSVRVPAERREWLTRYSAAVRDLGRRKGLPVVDLSAAIRGGSPAQAWDEPAAARLLAASLANVPEETIHVVVDSGGRFTLPEIEALRQAVVARNRLWFDYSRPMNWAFLGGDRTDQMSSRDHRDRKVRWFPTEMEQFVPLIVAADEKIWKQAEAVKGVR